MSTPLNSAQSPHANTLSSDVRMNSSTTTARATPSSASFATAAFARMPQERIAMSAGTAVPSASSTLSGVISAVFAPVKIRTPLSSAAFLSLREASSSSWRGISLSSTSITATPSPRFLSAHALSSPSTPPPMTAAVFAVASIRSIRSTSASLRIVAQFAPSAPGIGGTKHSAPIA